MAPHQGSRRRGTGRQQHLRRFLSCDPGGGGTGRAEKGAESGPGLHRLPRGGAGGRGRSWSCVVWVGAGEVAGKQTSAELGNDREPASELLGEVSCSVRTLLCNYRS